jgi:hypothetical protein
LVANAMELKTRITLAIAVMFAALLCIIASVSILVLYVRARHDPLPTSIFLLLPTCILCAFVVALLIVRGDRTRTETDVAAGFSPHRSWMTNAIKAGIVIYVLGLLNGIRLVAQHVIPLEYALVGFTICIVLIAVHWKALKRLDKLKQLATTPGVRVK